MFFEHVNFQPRASKAQNIYFLKNGPYSAFSTAKALGLGLLGPCGLAAYSDPPVVPFGPLGVSPDPPTAPSGPRGVSVTSGPFGVPPCSPACPPVPLVSLGSYNSVAIV
jgi:hypothetical protein